ncbi:transmembrane channel-like protein [Sabethes cyaneus]|uniref:transmembrane channel-like protein n=1 Tax=Sabethes cyaneus TaxID=53552 RepID=UPI00237D58AB|nr:transmembrane channel-like protein [Sabethes cyaneus]
MSFSAVPSTLGPDLILTVIPSLSSSVDSQRVGVLRIDEEQDVPRLFSTRRLVIGLKVNTSKTKYILAGETKTDRRRLGSIIMVDSDEFEFSPTSSVSPQLSVTWAFQLDGNGRTNGEEIKNFVSDDEVFDAKLLTAMKSPESLLSSEIQVPSQHDDEDYSASINAILKRKASVKKKKVSRNHRRTSSLTNQIMGGSGERRRSSVYTTSSGETAITLEEARDDSTQDKIFENIRLHKEVLRSVKLEPWSMKRKLKLVKQAKSYISKHEGVLQEHFSSRTAKSLLTQFNIFLGTKWRQLLREITNVSTYLIPWESRVKEIESHFGSVVASYFTFLRWLFWVNIVISSLLIVFVMMPEEIYNDREKVGCDIRKTMSHQEQAISSNFSTIWEFEGRLKYSSLFYGYYSTFSGAIARGYNLPLAYFLTGLMVYIYSFVATLKKMAKNSRMSKLSSKDDDYVFSWKLFTGWDYMIGHTETSQNRMASIILGFKEALLEEAEKKKDTRNWRIILLRIAVNLIILGLLAISAFAVVRVVQRSMDVDETDSWWKRNEITIVMSLITFFFPMFFETLGLLEYYHPRKQLRIQLARIMVLNLLNLYSLIFALFDKISHMTDELRKMKPANFTHDTQCFLSNINRSFGPSIAASSVLFDKPMSQPLFQDLFQNLTDNCYKVFVDCVSPNTLSTTLLTTLVMANYSFSQTSSSGTIDNMTIALNNFYDTMSTTDYTSSYDFDYDEEDAAYYLELRMRNLPIVDFDGAPINKREANNSFELAEIVNYTTFEYYNSTETISRETITDFITQPVETNSFETIKYDTTTGLTDSSTTDAELLETSYHTESTEENSKCYQWVCIEDPEDRATKPEFEYESSDFTKSDMFTTPGIYLTDPTVVIQASVVPSTESPRSGGAQESKFKNADIRTLCWETMFGQELAKLTIMDLIVTIFSTMVLDFFRALFVRYMNNCWCWDLEKTYPKYGDFKIAENILHLVNNQGMVWMGMFFSPGLAVINIFKLVIIMYLRSWTVLTCNVPHEVVFRASRSNNFYFALLLTMLFLCVLPVSYAIVFLEPSWHCGPFSHSNRIYHLLTNATDKIVPDIITRYIVSPAAVIPLLVLLILIIYYLISLTGSLREANQDLKMQLRKERTEERRKMFKIASNQHCQPNEVTNGLSSSWHKVLDSTTTQVKPATANEPNGVADGGTTGNNKHRELMQRMMKKALQKEKTLEPNPPTRTEENVSFTEISEKVGRNDLPTTESKPKGKFILGLDEGENLIVDKNRKTSRWVDNIPVITISKTSSDECILDSDVEEVSDSTDIKS